MNFIWEANEFEDFENDLCSNDWSDDKSGESTTANNNSEEERK